MLLTRLGSFLGLTAVTAIVASTAGAAESNVPNSLPVPGAFKLKASNGFSIFAFGMPAREGRPSSIGISVTGRRSEAFYAAPATITGTSIQADLGKLGAIDVTFHPSGEPESPRSPCGEKPFTFDSGSYEGTIVFRGEEGYTSVEATSAHGNIDFLLNLVCPGSSGGGSGPHAPGAELNAYADGTRWGPRLTVIKNRPTAPTHLEAGIGEEREGISIARYVNAIVPARAFKYDEDVQMAVVRPPAPFKGVAHFRRRKPANRWYGNLRVDFPGRSGVRLTGRHGRASLVHAHWAWH